MSSTTPNIGLTLPTGTEGWKRSVINGNFTILDTKIGAVGNTPLQTQINTLSSQISNTNANDCATVVDSGDGFAARKVGNILVIDFMSANRAHAEDELLFTLSSGYRPAARTKTIGSISTTPVVIDIAADGKCTIYLINGATSSARLYFHIVLAIA